MSGSSNFIDDYEAELLAKAKAEIAAEDAAFKALPQEEQDRISAERQKKLEGFFDLDDGNEEPDDEDDEDAEDDE